MAALPLASLWTCSPWKLPGVTADSSLSPWNPALLDWNILPQSPVIAWLSYQHAHSLPSPLESVNLESGICPSFLWINTVVLLQHTHTYTHIHTHSHSLTLLKPEINYTPCQSFLYYVPAILPCSLFWLTLLCICYQVLVMLHKWLSQVNASYRWTISFLRSIFDSSAWFAPYSKVDGHHGHPI